MSKKQTVQVKSNQRTTIVPTVIKPATPATTTTTDKSTLKKTAPPKPNKPRFNMPGQKKPTPAERDALRIFYTSLLKQRPNSRMALIWCLEHGLLSEKKATMAMLMLETEKLSLKSSSTDKKEKIRSPLRADRSS